jgi:hypothetical protein
MPSLRRANKTRLWASTADQMRALKWSRPRQVQRAAPSQVSARRAPIVWCSTDFFGEHAKGRRAKARKRGRTLEMKGELFVTQPALLREQYTAQHAFRR